MTSPFEFKQVEIPEKLEEGSHPFASDAVDNTDGDSSNPYAARPDNDVPYMPQYERIYKPRSGRLIACGIVSCILAIIGGSVVFAPASILSYVFYIRLVIASHLIGIAAGATALICGNIDRGAMKLNAVDPEGMVTTTLAIVFGGIGLASCIVSGTIYTATGLGWRWAW